MRKELSNEVLMHKMLIDEEHKSIKYFRDTAKKDADEVEKVRLSELVKEEMKNKIKVRYNSLLYDIEEHKTRLSTIEKVESLYDT